MRMCRKRFAPSFCQCNAALVARSVGFAASCWLNSHHAAITASRMMRESTVFTQTFIASGLARKSVTGFSMSFDELRVTPHVPPVFLHRLAVLATVVVDRRLVDELLAELAAA